MQKIREVVERLVKHEHDTVEVRAEAAAAEARSVALMERLVSHCFAFVLASSLVTEIDLRR